MRACPAAPAPRPASRRAMRARRGVRRRAARRVVREVRSARPDILRHGGGARCAIRARRTRRAREGPRRASRQRTFAALSGSSACVACAPVRGSGARRACDAARGARSRRRRAAWRALRVLSARSGRRGGGGHGESCPLGTFADETGREACEACPKGAFAAGRGPRVSACPLARFKTTKARRAAFRVRRRVRERGGCGNVLRVLSARSRTKPNGAVRAVRGGGSFADAEGAERAFRSRR